MFEKVNPSHPDKIADRIAGAIVDVAYSKEPNPKIAVEVMIGHGSCYVVVETTAMVNEREVSSIISRIGGDVRKHIVIVPQDKHLARNQKTAIRCGDNGIFKGVPLTKEQKELSKIARDIYYICPFDGKYIIDGNRLVLCQSNMKTEILSQVYPGAHINPLGEWTGGIDVDTGCCNRKLGSDMGDAVTGAGLHGKDLSKSDISISIYAFLEAQRTGKPVEYHCAIGDKTVNGIPYSEIVETARKYISNLGGFERFAEWGLI